MIRQLFIITSLLLIFSFNAKANPIISGISSNEINIDTKFQGAKILLFGAKGYAGNIVVTVRGPKKDFVITKKEKLLGVWYNGERVSLKNSYTLYSLFSTFNEQKPPKELLSELELGKDNIKFRFEEELDKKQKDEFKIQFIDQLEKKKLYSIGAQKVDFLDETLFKVMLEFPKNISRGVYTVEIYLIDDESLLSFQSIPIYVNQVGLSGKILDFAYQESFLYGLIAIITAIIVGWLANYIFARFIGK